MKNDNQIFVPIEVKEKGHNKTWYIDISRLGIASLIELRNELKGYKEDRAIRKIDAILHTEIGLDYRNRNMNYLESKKNSKIRKHKKQTSHGKRY